MGKKRTIVVVFAVASVALLALFAVVGALSSRGGDTGTRSAEPTRLLLPKGKMPPEAVGGAVAAAAGPSQSDTAGSSDASGGDSTYAALPPAGTASTHYLVRSGGISLLIAHGSLLATVDRIGTMTAGMGGYVMSSAIGSDSPGSSGVPVAEPQALDGQAEPLVKSMQPQSTIGTDPYADMTVRVPERTFDLAVKRFSALGEVQSVSTTSDDVTAQYVDLQAQLRHYHAVEARLVRFLAATTNVNEMLKVQDRIDAVQLKIDQLSAEIKSLRETTSYGTLTVSLREKGTQHAGAIDPSDTFSGTFWHSVKLIGHGARVTGLIFTALLPFIVVFGGISLGIWYVVRRLRRSHRPSPAPSTPA